MIAIDTNIVVRIVVVDDAKQAERARALVDAHEVFLAKSVVLETEWVLRGFYGYSPPRICKALNGFVRLPNVVAEDRPGVLDALQWAERGMDFADALHLVSARACESLASFDRKFARLAAKNAALKVWEP
jgi:predicted nucleic-acid-binding protein